ncbi:MAG: 16S rRNA (uracil(1498)-N(3))-methyltransferase [Ignavibacteriales bacterium]|nr:16S rRNA (uracil(1498)-N(3))-methyltransferase [Ignavibacteriales bacterium]
MDYFFVDPKDVHGQILIIRGDEYKHLSRVLRKKTGDHIVATDGNDNCYEVVIQSFDRAGAECEILDVKQMVNEPKIDVTLAVSLLKNPARLDFLVEKATELGVRTIVPMNCERTIPKHEKHTRLEKIALAAMKQCSRSYLPKISVLTNFDALVTHADEYDLRLIPHEKTEQSQFIGAVLRHHPKAKSILIMIGPEGGFSDEELAEASNNRFIPISLGPRRLRSETAGISAIGWAVGGW